MFRVRKSAATRRTQSSRYGTEKFTPIPGTKYFSSAAGLQTGPGTTFIECLMTQHQYKPLYSCCDPVFSGFFFPTNKRFPNFGMDIESRRCKHARWVVFILSKNTKGLIYLLKLMNARSRQSQLHPQVIPTILVHYTKCEENK